MQNACVVCSMMHSRHVNDDDVTVAQEHGFVCVRSWLQCVQHSVMVIKICLIKNGYATSVNAIQSAAYTMRRCKIGWNWRKTSIDFKRWNIWIAWPGEFWSRLRSFFQITQSYQIKIDARWQSYFTRTLLRIDINWKHKIEWREAFLSKVIPVFCLNEVTFLAEAIVCVHWAAHPSTLCTALLSRKINRLADVPYGKLVAAHHIQFYFN